MPLVFVHGVSVRDGKSYAENQATRDGLFRKYALKNLVPNSDKALIENPYWGQFGATPAWNSASLPDGKYESFGSSDGVFEEILVDLAADIQVPTQDKVLLTLARQSLPRAIDCLWAAGAFTDSGSAVGDALAEQSVRALEYAAAVGQPEWVDHVKDDDATVAPKGARLLSRRLDAKALACSGVLPVVIGDYLARNVDWRMDA